MIRVLIADDHPIFRDGLTTAIGSLDGVEVVGQAANGAEAVTLARAPAPDVVLMDLHMPEVNGIEATREIAAVTAVLVLTMLDADESVFAAMRGRARLPRQGRRAA